MAGAHFAEECGLSELLLLHGGQFGQGTEGYGMLQYDVGAVVPAEWLATGADMQHTTDLPRE